MIDPATMMQEDHHSPTPRLRCTGFRKWNKRARISGYIERNLSYAFRKGVGYL